MSDNSIEKKSLFLHYLCYCNGIWLNLNLKIVLEASHKVAFYNYTGLFKIWTFLAKNTGILLYVDTHICLQLLPKNVHYGFRYMYSLALKCSKLLKFIFIVFKNKSFPIAQQRKWWYSFYFILGPFNTLWISILYMIHRDYFHMSDNLIEQKFSVPLLITLL